MKYSDKQGTIEDLKKQIAIFCDEREWGQFHGIKDLAIGAVTESSELLEIFRFKSNEESNELLLQTQSRDAISDEMADVFFFLLRISEKYHIDLTESFYKKMQKNAQKYPALEFRGKNEKSHIELK